MKTILCGLLTLAALSFNTWAAFEYEGKLTISYPTGQSIEKPFILAYRHQDFDHEFQVGEYVFKVSGEPQSYSIAMLLKPNNMVWVQEFAKGQFQTFKLDVGDYKLKLVKRILNDPVKGDYVLSVNNVDYFFKQNLAQIKFKFDSDGIDSIDVDGMVASIGFNQSKDGCAELEEGSDEQKECELENQ